MSKREISLVLSMGGARGIAHIGVIEELVKNGFEITAITGSSMGAMVGAMYATGKLKECKEWLCTWDKRKMWKLADLSLNQDGLVKGDRFIRELKKHLPDVMIEDLILPYAALATDIAHECEVKFTTGSLFHAIRASISIPMLFRPVRSEGRILVDGGLLNPLPMRHAIRTPGSLLVAVDVNSPLANGKPLRMSPYKLLTESSRLMMQQITRCDLQRFPPDLLIELSARDYDMMEFHHASRIIQSGAEAARKAIADWEQNRMQKNDRH